VNSYSTVDIHDLIVLETDESFPWLADWEGALGDLSTFCGSLTHSGSPVRLRVKYVRRLKKDGTRQIGSGIAVDGESVFDLRYRARLSTPSPASITIETDNPCLEWLKWILQLALLRTDATLVHAAALEWDCGALIIPSWGGVGKTALSAGLLKEAGWTFLADDLVIISREGECYGFPKPLILYPYHRSLFPEEFARRKRVMTPVRWLSPMARLALIAKPLVRRSPSLLQFLRKHNPQSFAARPSQVFGESKLSLHSPIRSVVWLDRVGNAPEPALASLSSADMASRVMGATLSDFDEHCTQCISAGMGLGILHADDIYARWQRILENAFRNAAVHKLNLPQDLAITSLTLLTKDILRKSLETATPVRRDESWPTA